MPKIINYAVIYPHGGMSTADLVNKFINDGWQPYGSPFGMEMGIYQAMVKYQEEK